MFGVWNDYGKLREVAVGTTEGFVVPTWVDTFRFMPERAQGILRNHGGKPAAGIPEVEDWLGPMQVELDHLASVYESYGVVVHRPRQLTQDELGYLENYQGGLCQVYPADPIWMVGRHAIECQLRYQIRNKEILALRELVLPLAEADPDARIGACPISGPVEGSAEDRGPRLEGGDIFLCGDDDRTVLVGIDPIRSSNEFGVEWLRRYLSDDGWKVVGVPINQDGPIHLLAVLGTVGPGIGLIYRPALTEGVPDAIADWDLIDVTLEETHQTGPCVVMIDEKTVLVPEETPRIAEEIAKRGVEPVPIPTAGIASGDGGIRCATFVIRRDP